MAELLWNDPSALTLSGGINNSVTSLTVSSSLSVTPNFRIRIDDELLSVTNVSGTTWTVTRGVESSVAASHSSAATIHIVATAEGVNQWYADLLGTRIALAANMATP